MIYIRKPEWGSDDMLALREFLQTKTGNRMWENLQFHRPGFTPSGAAKDVSFAQARDIAGYEKALRELLYLTQPPPEEQAKAQKAPDMYPPLDDDAQWENQ